MKGSFLGIDNFGSNNFDVISFFDVLEHIPHLEQVLLKARSLLYPGGILICKVPSSNGFFFSLLHLLYSLTLHKLEALVNLLWQTETAYPHLWYFNKSNLKTFLRKYRFEVKSLEWDYLFDPELMIHRIKALKESKFKKVMQSKPILFALRKLVSVQNIYKRERMDVLTVFARLKNSPQGGGVVAADEEYSHL